MAVGFGNTSTTDFQSGNGTTGSGLTLSMPSGAVADDYVWVLRHHSAANSNMSAGPGSNSTIKSDGYIPPGTTVSGYYANGSTALMGTYRRVVGGDGNWTWTPAGSDYTWATVRFTGADVAGTPFVGGTGITTSDAGAGSGSGNPITFTIGNAVSGDMGVVVIACNSASAPTVTSGTGWTVTTLRSGATRNFYMAFKSYSGTVTGDTMQLTFGASVSWVSRHGVIKAAPAGTTITGVGVPSAEASGYGQVIPLQYIGGFGIPTAEASGYGTITVGDTTITGIGAPSGEASGYGDAAYGPLKAMGRVVMVGDSITQGAQAYTANGSTFIRWSDRVFGPASSIGPGDGTSPSSFYTGTFNGQSVRVGLAAVQGMSAQSKSNYNHSFSKGDGTVDALVIMLGVNDEWAGVSWTLTNFEDAIVELANGGRTTGSNTNDLPKARYVLLVGEWQFRAGSGIANLNANFTHAQMLSTLAGNCLTRIQALAHVKKAAYVTVGADAHRSRIPTSSVTVGTDTAQADAGGSTGYAIGGSDYIHPSGPDKGDGHLNVYAPTVMAGLTDLLGGFTQTITGVGVPSAEASGFGAMGNGQGITGIGVPSAETSGFGAVTTGTASITGVGVPSAEASGFGAVTVGTYVITGSGVTSLERVGFGTFTVAGYVPPPPFTSHVAGSAAPRRPRRSRPIRRP